MDRELVLAILACLACGPALAIAGLLPLPLHPTGSALADERAAWRRLWAPIIPAALIFAFLVGWALQEPESAEAAEPALLFVAAMFAMVACRAGVRAARALRTPARAPAAMTIGLLRPRVVISDELAERLDPRALDAAIAHEAAHARHLDPLRMWLAQIATDLQWSRRAARRFADWRTALEFARDAEACEHVDGGDLAAALIEAARLYRGCDAAAIARLVESSDGADVFVARIRRLLDDRREPEAPPARTWRLALALGAAVGAAVLLGAHHGEWIVSWLPGIAD